MPLPTFILNHIERAANRLHENEKSSELLYAYVQLLNLVVTLTFSYFALLFFSLSLISLQYFNNKRIIAITLSLICMISSLFLLFFRSQYSFSNTD
jgi:hypothetical protein